MSEPLVTVLLPVYNGERYIKGAIESILCQSYTHFELLIIDDGSEDNTDQIITSFKDERISHVKNKINLGLVQTLNKGLSLAKGDLIARQDADDVSYPDRLKKQVEYMVENEETALLGTQGRVVDENGQSVYVGSFSKPERPIGIRWSLCFDNAFIHTSVMFRKKIILDKFQGYKEFTSLKSKSPGQDYELWSRVSKNQAVANLPDVLVDCREHSRSISSSLSGDKGEIAQKGNLEIVTSNVRNVFGLDTYSEDQIKLIAQFRHGITGNDYIKVLAVLGDMVSKYVERFPEAKNDPKFMGGVAMQLADLAYPYLGKNNLAAIKIYAKSAKYRPGVMLRWPWLKMLLLMLFGERSREIYRNWKKLCV